MAEEHNEIDAVTGTATTGHEWDGIRELNTPLPRWWLWLFYITIVWAIGYWIVYPAWPLLTSYTQGVLGWHSRERHRRRSRRAQAQRGADDGQARRGFARRDRRRSAAARLRPRAGPRRLRRQLRAVPRRGRRRRQGLSQSQRRRLAVGRQARRYRHHHPPRRRARPTTKARHGQHAGLRPRQDPEAERDRGGRRLRALAVRPAGRRRMPISRSARRCSPTIAPPVTATTARATASSARPISPTRSGSTAPARQTIVEGLIRTAAAA